MSNRIDLIFLRVYVIPANKMNKYVTNKKKKKKEMKNKLKNRSINKHLPTFQFSSQLEGGGDKN